MRFRVDQSAQGKFDQLQCQGVQALDFCRSNHIHGVEEDCKRIVNVFIQKKTLMKILI